MTHRAPSHTHSGFAVLRTPLLPLSAWRELTAQHAPPPEDEAELAAWLKQNDHDTEREMLQVIEQPAVGEAMYLASPSALEACAAWRRGERGQRALGSRAAVLRYLTRLCSRCTPFGLFAGWTLLDVAQRSRLTLGPLSSYRTHTRLDSAVLESLRLQLEREPTLKSALRWRPNPSLYRVGDELRYIEARALPGGLRDNAAVSVASTSALLVALEAAHGPNGATRDELARSICRSEPDIAFVDAGAFVDALVEQQLLWSELAPSATGAPAMAALSRKLAKLPQGAAIAAALNRLDNGCQELDALPLGRAPASYPDATLAGVVPDVGPTSSTFQVDLLKPAAAELGVAVIHEVERCMQALWLLQPQGTLPLDRFRRAFQARYGDRPVRLAEALDEETGVGYDAETRVTAPPAGLLEGMVWRRPSSEGDEPVGPRHRLLLAKYAEALSRGARSIRLELTELEGLPQHAKPPLPDGISVLCELYASSLEAVDAGELTLLIRGFAGPSGSSLFGRFCHGDAKLEKRVRQHMTREQALAGDRVLAEVAHLPQTRLGNLVGRPRLRAHQINYLSLDEARADDLGIEDLWLKVEAGHVKLYSEKLTREVLPRLACAHAVSPFDLPIYRFLEAFASQGHTTQMAFDWGPLRSAPFLPRVVIGRSIVAEATWNLDVERWRALAGQPRVPRFQQLQGLRRELELPRIVLACSGDQRLLVDFENGLSVDTLFDAIRSGEISQLREALLADEQLCVEGPEGRFVNELAIPLIRREPPPDDVLAAPVRPRLPSCSTVHKYPPGSEWLSLKLYTGPVTAERLLLDRLWPVVSELQAAGRIDRWFFLRYADPQPHLRMRLHAASAELVGQVLQHVSQAVAGPLERDLLHAVHLDTYEPEVERYGGPRFIAWAERIFWADSELVVSTLGELTVSDEDDDEARWRHCCLGLHALLVDLGFELEARAELTEAARAGYRRELVDHPAFEDQIARRFRNERAWLDGLARGSEAPPGSPMSARTSLLTAAAQELRRLAAEDALGTSPSDVAFSFLHMHANRMLRSDQRVQELVLLDLLCRTYRSQLARKRHDRTAQAGVR